MCVVGGVENAWNVLYEKDKDKAGKYLRVLLLCVHNFLFKTQNFQLHWGNEIENLWLRRKTE